MIRSMTGFGRGEAGEVGLRWLVECASVNRKQLEVVISLPREVAAAELEPALRAQVQAKVSRGRVQVQVQRVVAGDQALGAVQVDQVLAAGYVRELTALAEGLGIEAKLTLADLVKLPGVVQSAKPEVVLAEEGEQSLKAALEAALDQMVTMREAEGRNLHEDMEGRLQEIERLLAEIAAKAPQVVEQHRTQLHQRLAEAGVEVALDDERLVKELALYADRCDISEELARAASHVQQFRSSLLKKEAVGRSLDFLAQEFFREFNTMGSKANNAALSHLVVAAKTELEKIREQVQNVE
jgi:uncharacterized protein (TIGR00255 family)